MQPGNQGKMAARASCQAKVESIMDLTVTAGVEGELAALAKLAPDLARGSLAATALELARTLDGDSSATSKSMCARALIDVLDNLRELSPPQAALNALDELTAKRAARLQ